MYIHCFEANNNWFWSRAKIGRLIRQKFALPTSFNYVIEKQHSLRSRIEQAADLLLCCWPQRKYSLNCDAIGTNFKKAAQTVAK